MLKGPRGQAVHVRPFPFRPFDFWAGRQEQVEDPAAEVESVGQSMQEIDPTALKPRLLKVIKNKVRNYRCWEGAKNHLK